MKRFIKKVLVLGLIAIGVYVLEYLIGSLYIGGQYDEGYNAAVLDKMARLGSVKSPKIILIGNSNVCFGVDSLEMERELGCPVVNMGLHGGLGNEFHERMVDGFVSKGDCVIIMHTDYSKAEEIREPFLAWTALEYHTGIYHLVPTCDILDMIRTYPKYFKTTLEMKLAGRRYAVSGAYRRDAFNDRGDNIYPRQNVTYQFEAKDAMLNPEIHPVCRNRLNKLCREVRAKDAYLLIAGFPLHTGEFAQNEEDIRALQYNLETQLEADVISCLMDYRFDPSCFYDTPFHLNETGVRIRTRLLISDIKKWRQKAGLEVPSSQ